MSVEIEQQLSAVDQAMKEASTPTRWERFLSRVAPKRAMDAYRARNMMAMQGAWTGARHDIRSMREWHADPGSADATSVLDLPELRARSRDLTRNSGLAHSAIETQVLYTAGSSLRVDPMPDFEALEDLGITINDEDREKWVRMAKRVWTYHEAHLDAERKHHGADLDDIVIRGILESGDCAVVRRFIPRPGSRYGTRLQVIEADRVSTPLALGGALITPFGLQNPAAMPVLDGVERLTDTGEPVAYWIASTHPGDGGYLQPRTWTRLPAWDDRLGQRLVLHPFIGRRPGQTRGWPLLGPVIEEIKQTHRFVDAELMASVLASYFTVFIKSKGGSGFANMAGQQGTSTENTRTLSDEVALGQGAVVPLDLNEEVDIADPKRPNENAFDFIDGMAGIIGAATGTPRSVLLKKFMASYSASRGELLEMWRATKSRRAWFFRAYKTPTYEWTITEAVAMGDLPAPGFFQDPRAQAAWLRVGWIGDPQGQIDPAKETAAAKVMLNEIGIGTKSRATIDLTGGDFEADAKQRARENELEDELGLTPEPPSIPGQSGPPGLEPGDGDED